MALCLVRLIASPGSIALRAGDFARWMRALAKSHQFVQSPAHRNTAAPTGSRAIRSTPATNVARPPILRRRWKHRAGYPTAKLPELSIAPEFSHWPEGTAFGAGIPGGSG